MMVGQAVLGLWVRDLNTTGSSVESEVGGLEIMFEPIE